MGLLKGMTGGLVAGSIILSGQGLTALFAHDTENPQIRIHSYIHFNTVAQILYHELEHLSSLKGDPETIKYIPAIIQVESAGKIDAVSSAGALGLMQLTVPAIIDAADHCGISRLVTKAELIIPETNIKYGMCYLDLLHSQFDGDWMEILTVYNGGYKSLTRLRRGVNVNHETANYVVKVQYIITRKDSN